MGWDHQSELAKHASQTDAVKGFGGRFGVQKDHKDKVSDVNLYTPMYNRHIGMDHFRGPALRGKMYCPLYTCRLQCFFLFSGGQTNVLRNKGGSWVGTKAFPVKIGLGGGGGGGQNAPIKLPKNPGLVHQRVVLYAEVSFIGFTVFA